MGVEARIRLADPWFDDDQIQDVIDVLRSGHLVQGQRVAVFERRVADYLGVPEAVACASGTAALHLALLAMRIQPGDEVIIPDFTFPSAANMIDAVGGTPVPVDIEPGTFNIDPAQVEAHLGPRTRAIMPVHQFGLMADMNRLQELAEPRGVLLFEDAACALGATYPSVERGEVVPTGIGQAGVMACVSFHPRKIITTAEGGMVVSRSEVFAERLRRLRNHGAHHEGGRMRFDEIGFNYRMTEVQGALGAREMSRVDQGIAHRRRVAAIYDDALSGLPLQVPMVPDGFGHVYQSYVVMLEPGVDRDGVIQALARAGVEATLGAYALHAQPYYRRKYGLDPAAFPRSRAAFERSLALPIHQRMTEEQAGRVAEVLKEILTKGRW